MIDLHMKKVPMKNINSRIDEKNFYEIQAVAWYMGISRSDLIRAMVQAFCRNGTISYRGEKKRYKELTKLAMEELAEKDMDPRNLVKTKKQESDIEDSLPNLELDEIVKQHVKSVKKAWEESQSQKNEAGGV
ncbi:type II toxin-antitoxin system RelB/DinJ family antitoxin [Sporosarcina sp. OR05]|uniref:type II toxin-antitoxin system RelB/DinJ family antitoxin n=1 Tax=Sporosarcina sp. OR05 TaxID=2969819 RepID=UPI00352A483E